jgi:hypothetical protein
MFNTIVGTQALRPNDADPCGSGSATLDPTFHNFHKAGVAEPHPLLLAEEKIMRLWLRLLS